jgi:predicted transglutaminase-like protease
MIELLIIPLCITGTIMGHCVAWVIIKVIEWTKDRLRVKMYYCQGPIEVITPLCKLKEIMDKYTNKGDLL